MGPLGWQEMAFIFVLALLLFGPKKLPEIGRTLGKAMTEFKRASNELKATFDRELSSLERENESLKEVTSGYNPENYSHDYSSDSSYYDGGYHTPSDDSTATETSTVSASATQGAESSAAVATPEHPAPEGTVAHSADIEGTPATHEVAAAETHPAVEQQVHGQNPSNS